MNRNEITRLQSHNSYPAVSILMPMVRNHPESRQNVINIKNMVRQVKEQLNGTGGSAGSEDLVRKVEAAVEKIDFAHPQDGLALFVSGEITKSFMLPFTVKERVSVNSTFETRDLVHSYNRSRPYFVISLDEKFIRIYRGLLNRLEEVNHPELPVKSLKTDVKEDFDPQSRNIESRGTENQDKLKNYFRDADRILKEMAFNEKVPFVITGSEKEIGLYKELTAMPELVIGTVSGSYNKTGVNDLAEHVWPAVKEAFNKEREKALLEADKATGAKKFASGIEEVWQAAQEGRGMKLLVEENYSCPAKVDMNGTWLSQGNETAEAEQAGSNAENILPDAVDELIEKVIATGGEVVFFNDGELESYNRIAMILRY